MKNIRYTDFTSVTLQGNILITHQYKVCILLAAALLAGCGGGGSAPQGSVNCSLSSTAGCGGTLQPGTTPPPPDPALTAASVNLVFSSNELASAGTPGTDVLVTALVKTAANTAVAGAKVEFSADSGLLAGASAITDQSGKAVAALGTGGSKVNRTITVSATAGRQTASGVVNVTGTRLTFSGPAFLALGTSAELVATLVDSAGRPIAGAELAATTLNGNTVQLPSKISDSRGQVPLQLSASKRGNEQVTLAAMGASMTRTILVGGSDVILTPAVLVDAGGTELLSQIKVGTCAPVGGSYMVGGTAQSGNVTLNASRGQLFRDAGCTQPLVAPMALVAGQIPGAWIKSANAGVSSIDASVAGGPSASTRVEFIAPLCSCSSVNLQSDAAVVGSGERSNLIAVVRDGTAANNLVKGATVQFSILADPSGGSLLSPFTAVTGSDGIARAVFVAGPADGGKNATVIQARIAELPAVTAVTNLTVNKKALSIQFGTGNLLDEFSPAVLQQDYAVFVADSAGNPVGGVAISAAAWPTTYKKGYYRWYIDTSNPSDKGAWQVSEIDAHVCSNEDVARKGLYEPAFDTNNNGVLDPGIPLTVITSGKTDAMGMTTVSLRYPRDRANWVRVELTVTGTVAGTESLARNAFWLRPLAKDLNDAGVSPPGQTSPYGRSDCISPD
jgi:hypothetical protein